MNGHHHPASMANDVPIAPPLFTASSSSSRSPFTAKSNPFLTRPETTDSRSSHSSRASQAKCVAVSPISHSLASSPSPSPSAPLSAPHSSASSHVFASPTTSTTSSSQPSSAPHWKASLRARCVERVKQQREAIRDRMRARMRLTAMDSGTNMSMSMASDFSMQHHSNSKHQAAATAASTALEESLRTIINEQMQQQRQKQNTAATSFATAASSSSAYCLPAVPTASSSSSVVFPSSSSSSSSSSAPSPFAPSFVDDDALYGDLSPGEYMELMQQLEEEVRAELEQEMMMMEMQGSTSTSNGWGSSGSKNSDPALAAYEAAAMDELEDAISAYEWSEAAAHGQTISCPCCHRSLQLTTFNSSQCFHSAAASSSPHGNSGVSCPCGFKAACGSLTDLQSQLTDARERHATRCLAQPKFLCIQDQQTHASMSARSSASAFSSTPAPPSPLPSLFLACDTCGMWSHVPIHAHAPGTGSAASGSSSTASAFALPHDDDYEMS